MHGRNIQRMRPNGTCTYDNTTCMIDFLVIVKCNKKYGTYYYEK